MTDKPLGSNEFRSILTQNGLDYRSDADLTAIIDILAQDGLESAPETPELITYAARKVVQERRGVIEQPTFRTEVQTMSDQFDNAAFRDILSGAGLNPDSLEDINAFKSALDAVEGDSGPEVLRQAAVQAKLDRREAELKAREAKGERVNANEWMTLGYEREAAKRAPAKPATNPIDLIPTEQLSDPTELMRRGLAEQRRKLQKK